MVKVDADDEFKKEETEPGWCKRQWRSFVKLDFYEHPSSLYVRENLGVSSPRG